MVTCRYAEQSPEWCWAEETSAVPVPPVTGVPNPSAVMLPDSKLAATTVFPGYWLVGAGVPG
ncbi:hypothetical protein GCM10009825_07560 [Arthrobacter humicola]|uniref:Uncharacterized protein n=1 Tax=Arthrobacter humicola TaxID=409291 RepID=A0ABN2YJR2_9MICC